MSYGRFAATPEFAIFHADNPPKQVDGVPTHLWEGLSVSTASGHMLDCEGVALFAHETIEGSEYEVTVLGMHNPP